MAKLTEDMVTARARGADITTLRKLNCWGACLSDVSLLRRMTNLEVIAFSVNQITSLSDFSDCVRLHELYLRGNRISDLNQLCYLQQLPSLRQLLLKENPIESAPLYRETVLRALPWLHSLDDRPVAEGEVEHARRVGRELVHPLRANSSPSSSRSSSPRGEDCNEEYYAENNVAENNSPERVQQYADSEGDSAASSPRASLRRSPPPPSPLMADPATHAPPTPARTDFYDRDADSLPRSTRYIYDEGVEPVDGPRLPDEATPPVEPSEEGYMDEMVVRCKRRSMSMLCCKRHSMGMIYCKHRNGEEEQSSCDRTYRQVQDMGASLSRLSTPRPPRPTGIRSSNVLSSVLLLIKELDVVALEVVQVNVESRIRELCDG